MVGIKAPIQANKKAASIRNIAIEIISPVIFLLFFISDEIPKTKRRSQIDAPLIAFPMVSRFVQSMGWNVILVG